jgi:hypothetical protein
MPITNYQLPNGLIKVRRRWGQRHPQGANPGMHSFPKQLQANLKLMVAYLDIILQSVQYFMI